MNTPARAALVCLAASAIAVRPALPALHTPTPRATVTVFAAASLSDAFRELGGLDLSARNQLRGRVTALHSEGLMAEVRIAIGDQELVAVITRSSAERLGLEVGDLAVAVIKSTEVMIGKGAARP